MLSAIEPEAARANTQRAGLGRFDPLGRPSPNDRNLRKRDTPAEAGGVDVEHKMPIAAIDVQSPAAKCKTRQVRLWRGSGFRLLSARYGDRLGRRLGTDHI